jgi:hypothetical protein
MDDLTNIENRRTLVAARHREARVPFADARRLKKTLARLIGKNRQIVLMAQMGNQTKFLHNADLPPLLSKLQTLRIVPKKAIFSAIAVDFS